MRGCGRHGNRHIHGESPGNRGTVFRSLRRHQEAFQESNARFSLLCDEDRLEVHFHFVWNFTLNSDSLYSTTQCTCWQSYQMMPGADLERTRHLWRLGAWAREAQAPTGGKGLWRLRRGCVQGLTEHQRVGVGGSAGKLRWTRAHWTSADGGKKRSYTPLVQSCGEQPKRNE